MVRLEGPFRPGSSSPDPPTLLGGRSHRTADPEVPRRHADGTSGFCVCPKRVAADTLQGMRRLANTLLVSILASPLAVTATAVAQAVPRDPNIGQGQRTSVWIGYLIAGVFAAILVGLTLFPSKRQSEDL